MFWHNFRNCQPQAREKGEKEGFKISVAKTSFKANTKALAENEGEGIAKVGETKVADYLWLMKEQRYLIAFVMQMIYRPDNGEILGVHIFGLHAADLIHEASNAIALGTRIQVGFRYSSCLFPWFIVDLAFSFWYWWFPGRKSSHIVLSTIASENTKCNWLYKVRIQFLIPAWLLVSLQDIKLAVHAHPTLSEVLDELFKAAKVKQNTLKSFSKTHTMSQTHMVNCDQ